VRAWQIYMVSMPISLKVTPSITAVGLKSTVFDPDELPPESNDVPTPSSY